MTEKKPVIFGIGGLLERGERGKTSDMLDILATQYHCRTYEVTFAGIKKDGDTIVCELRPGDLDNLQRTVDHARTDGENDMSCVGVIVSSMGAVPFIEYLSASRDLAKSSIVYATIAPFTRINPLARKFVTGALDTGEPLDISSEFDKGRKIKRLIQVASLPYILEFDATNRLKGCANTYKVIPLTIMATRDKRVDIRATEESHYLLNGTDESLVRIESDHFIPYESCRDPIIEFMVRSLNLKQSA